MYARAYIFSQAYGNYSLTPIPKAYTDILLLGREATHSFAIPFQGESSRLKANLYLTAARIEPKPRGKVALSLAHFSILIRTFIKLRNFICCKCFRYLVKYDFLLNYSNPL